MSFQYFPPELLDIILTDVTDILDVLCLRNTCRRFRNFIPAPVVFEGTDVWQDIKLKWAFLTRLFLAQPPEKQDTTMVCHPCMRIVPCTRGKFNAKSCLICQLALKDASKRILMVVEGEKETLDGMYKIKSNVALPKQPENGRLLASPTFVLRTHPDLINTSGISMLDL